MHSEERGVLSYVIGCFFFFQAEDGIRDLYVTGVQTCALPISAAARPAPQLLPPNERRRAPDSVAVALESALAACHGAQLEPSSLGCVFGSTHGDLAITDYMCTTLAADRKSVV